MKPLLLLVSVLALLGCAEPSKEPVSYKGVYTYGFEVSVFSPDKEAKEYWLYSENQSLEEVENMLTNTIIEANGDNPYPSVRIEFYGIDEGQPSINGGEIPSSYDALMNVSKVVNIEKI